jgi:hypothetical protein
LLRAGLLPASMATMYNLVVFNLNNNLLTGRLNDFAFQTINNRQDLHSRLRYFDIGNNSFVGAQPGRFAYYGNIHALGACCLTSSVSVQRASLAVACIRALCFEKSADKLSACHHTAHRKSLLKSLQGVIALHAMRLHLCTLHCSARPRHGQAS